MILFPRPIVATRVASQSSCGHRKKTEGQRRRRVCELDLVLLIGVRASAGHGPLRRSLRQNASVDQFISERSNYTGAERRSCCVPFHGQLLIMTMYVFNGSDREGIFNQRRRYGILWANLTQTKLALWPPLVPPAQTDTPQLSHSEGARLCAGLLVVGCFHC